jgi:hypothetical protein
MPSCCPVTMHYPYFIILNEIYSTRNCIFHTHSLTRTNLLSTNLLSLHTTEQLVEGTMKLCIYHSKDESHDNHPYHSSECWTQVTMKVILMQLGLIRCSRILCGIFSGKKCVSWSGKYSSVNYEMCPESEDTKVLNMYNIFNLKKRRCE